jgi:hypothetical protein
VIKRTAAILAWLVVGHAVLGGLYWALLLVPESNVLMLSTSLLVVLCMVWWLGLVEGVGLLAWQADGGLRASLTPAARRAWLVVFPLVVFALVWWITGLASGWLDRHWSEIDAWILLKTGWTNTAVLMSGCKHLIAFVRYGFGASLALALFVGLLRTGLGGLASVSWVRRAFAWRQLVIIAAALVVGVLLPAHLAYWRWQPKSVSATWFEPAFAVTKLSLMFLVANLAWAAVLRAISREAQKRQ